ncbi:helix-turn-helix transcriptional regulator [Kibdelosporangium philippinense]|uniref:Helix-turn-helix transcriptional regulator n=2 Tax=Kibdelosporangium philippinense TaxID=211113 RepID=A0ABS8ZRL1_9PSEU|nr:helix-turn-helix domain-containing protein [Kibdelosporangium philippinense]MCE7010384.1 helix-turn-helix transcriptional regulator [Kibdelosporangium philippinense]
MPKRTSHEDATCPVARPLDALGDGWSLLIIRDAFDGLRRFGEFQKNLGLAKNILSARLHNLVAHGILHTVPASDGSPYQEYVLTEKGRGLFPVLVALRQWSEEHLFEPAETRTRLIDKENRQPVAKVKILSQDGRPLTPEDTTITKRRGDE